MGPPGKAHRVLGAITLVLAAGLLFLILIPSLIPLLLAWCVVEVLYWMLVTCPTAKQLDAQPAEGHWPPAAEKVDLTHFNRFLKVSVFPIRIHPSCCSTKGPVWHPAAGNSDITRLRTKHAQKHLRHLQRQLKYVSHTFWHPPASTTA